MVQLHLLDHCVDRRDGDPAQTRDARVCGVGQCLPLPALTFHDVAGTDRAGYASRCNAGHKRRHVAGRRQKVVAKETLNPPTFGRPPVRKLGLLPEVLRRGLQRPLDLHWLVGNAHSAHCQGAGFENFRQCPRCAGAGSQAPVAQADRHLVKEPVILAIPNLVVDLLIERQPDGQRIGADPGNDGGDFRQRNARLLVEFHRLAGDLDAVAALDLFARARKVRVAQRAVIERLGPARLQDRRHVARHIRLLKNVEYLAHRMA